MIFTIQNMQEIMQDLQQKLEKKDTVSFKILNPDLHDGYAGDEVVTEGKNYIYRGMKSWADLAELLMCKLLLPKKVEYPLVMLTLKKLHKKSSFHLDNPENKNEKYGVQSNFFSIHKMEEPSFLYYYKQALNNVNIEKRKRVLNLGVNRGDEFEIIKNSLDASKYKNIELLGIDHSKTAIEYAKSVFKEENVKLYIEDINNIERLSLGKFNLLISIGTLQSPSINFKPFFMSLVQNYLEKDSAIILGFPNCRWIGGEMVYGAKVPNYSMSEMSLLFSDVIFCKKYLQQKKFRVTITGKQYIFLTATKIN